MLLGAAGVIVPFFFLGWSENLTGFAAFGLAAGGLLLGSLLGRPIQAATDKRIPAEES